VVPPRHGRRPLCLLGLWGLCGVVLRAGVLEVDPPTWEALRSGLGHASLRPLLLPKRDSWAGQASRAISTARLSTLPCLHLPPIDVLVSNGPSESFRSGSARLGGGFPLRCFQRFSRP